LEIKKQRNAQIILIFIGVEICKINIFKYEVFTHHFIYKTRVCLKNPQR